MKLGIYVGSFDPIHNGHEDVVKHLISKKYLDKVIVIPTLNYWDKQNLTTLSHRINMVKLVFNKNVIVNEDLSKYEYTYQIMDELKNIYPNDTLFLIIGADNVKDFYKWKRVEDILKNYVLIIPRDKIDIDFYIKDYKDKERFIIVNSFNLKNISSTFIRENINFNNSIKELVNSKVLEYIRRNKLYKD